MPNGGKIASAAPRQSLEEIWQNPTVRAPLHVAGLLPAEEAANRGRLELSAAEDGPLDRLVTVKGRRLNGAPCPKVEWPDPPAPRKPRKRDLPRAHSPELSGGAT